MHVLTPRPSLFLPPDPRFMNCRVPGSKRYQPTEYEHAANCATHGVSRADADETHTLRVIAAFSPPAVLRRRQRSSEASEKRMERTARNQG